MVLHETANYRVVIEGVHSRGYADRITLEFRGKDALGGDSWHTCRALMEDDPLLEFARDAASAKLRRGRYVEPELKENA